MNLPVKEQSSQDLIETVLELYKVAHAITGYKSDKKRAASIDIPATVQLIQELHPRRDKEDLQLAVKWGALGRYGEFTGINPKTILGWIKSYEASAEFKEKLRAKKEPQNQLPPPPMDYTQAWEECKAEYKQTGVLPQGAGSLYFNAAHKLRLFDWDNKEFVEEVKYQARCKMLDRIRDIKGVGSVAHLRDQLKDEKSDAFRTECKRQAVKLILNRNGE